MITTTHSLTKGLSLFYSTVWSHVKHPQTQPHIPQPLQDQETRIM
jgi:hypothetical protein